MRFINVWSQLRLRETRALPANARPGKIKTGAAQLLIAMAGLGLLAGCGGDDNERTEVGGDTTEVSANSNLTGFVTDTNGAGIAGATVTVAGRTTTTGQQGEWTVEDVPVVNLQNNSDTPCAGTGGDSASGVTGGCTGQPLPISVIADGYLGGNGFVTPEGQIFSSENAPSITGDLGGQTNPQTVIWTGGTAVASNIELPELGAAIRVNVIEAASGQPFVGPIDLDFDQVCVNRQSEEGGSGSVLISLVGCEFLVSLDGLNDLLGDAEVEGGYDNIGEYIDSLAALLDFLNSFGQGLNFSDTLFSGVTDESGSLTFTGLPADSLFALRGNGIAFDDCNADEPPEVTDDCDLFSDDIATSGRRVAPGGTASACAAGSADRNITLDVGASLVTSNAGDICILKSDDVTTRVDYVGLEVKPITPTGDLRNPYLAEVTGVFSLVSADCDGCEAHGLLLEGIDQIITFTYSEDLALISAEDVLVYNQTTDSYVTVNTVAQTGDTVTITLAAPLPEGTFFKVFLLVPGHRDLANNVLLDAPSTTLEDPVPFDQGFSPDACSDGPEGCLGIAYVEVRLCTFFRPDTDPGAVTDVAQEEFDPRLIGPANDWPINQTRSVSFNDVRDGDDGAFNEGDLTYLTLDVEGPIQQFNAPNQLLVPFYMGLLAQAFGEESPTSLGVAGLVDTDVARVEFTPLDGFDTYRVVVERSGVPTTIGPLNAADFPLGAYVDQGNPSPFMNVETAAVDRSGVIRNAFIYEAAQAGDVITIFALDDLGNPGAASAPVTIVDNVEPTVGIQTSYNDLHDYTAGTPDENDDASQGGCLVRNSFAAFGSTTTTTDSALHAGVVADGGTDDIGSGGEVSTGGEPGSASNVCIGISPELLIASADTDGNIDTAHDELVAGRSAGLTTILNSGPPIPASPYADEIYDDQAYAAWPVAARQVGSGDTSQGGMGIAITEDLAAVGTPTDTVDDTTLTNYAVQNNTVAQPTVNGFPRNLTAQNLVRVTVGDALALANLDAGEVINLTGISDVAGNAASAAAAAVVQIRDQWAPYMTSAFRTLDGDLVFTWNEPVVIDDGDVLSFAANVAPIVTFTFNTVGTPNFTQSGDGLTVTIDAADVATFAPGLATLLTNSGLVYDDINASGDPILGASHVIVDWRTIADAAGNSWQIYNQSFADATPFFDDVPGFALVDSIGPFGVVITQPGFTAGLAQFTLSYTFSHPIFLDTDDVCGTANTIAPIIVLPVGGELGFLGTNGTLEVASGAADPDFTAIGFTIEPLDIVSSSATDTTISFDIDLSQDATMETLASGDSIATANVAVSQLICGTMGDTVGPATQVVP